MFKIRNVHISRLATRSPLHPVSSPEAVLLSPAYPALLLRFPKPGVPRSSSSFASASMALRPAGVHAQPSPNILAMKLVAIYCLASCFFGISGKRKDNKGCIPVVSRAISPDFSAIFISPIHNAMTPAMVMHSETASPAEESAASVTAAILPVNAA